jgi:biotin carboxyl carrier protein
MRYEVEVGGKLRHLQIDRDAGRFVVSLDGREWHIDASRVDAHLLSLIAGSASFEVTIARHASESGQFAIGVGSVPLIVSVNGQRRWSRKEEGAGAANGPQRLAAPMPGKIVRVLVSVGEIVQRRQPLIVVEAMKMENELRATHDGVVAELLVREGQSVDAGTLLAVIKSS